MQPRMILPGTTYMVTRRTTQRQFLLRPCRQTNQVFRYCLALAARKTEVQVHAVCVMSNHYHLVCTDVRGLLPKFVAELNKLVAKCLNSAYGRWENFWAGGIQPSYVRLEDAEAVLSRSVYTLTNPAGAGLVPSGSQWPGVHLWQPGRYQAVRPNFFFSESGKLPKKLELEIVPLSIDDSCHAATAQLKAAVAEREAIIRAEFKTTGRPFLGAKAVKAQRFQESPNNNEPRRKLSPQIASRDKWRRIEAIQRLKGFVAAYRLAMTKWKQGVRTAVFPAGAYAMKLHHGVACAPT